MTREKYNESIKPFVVMVCICIVVALVLSVTNAITAPVIENNNAIAAAETRSAVLPGSGEFSPVDIDYKALGIDSAFVDKNGMGYVITATNNGYKGDVTVTVGIDPEGAVVNVIADVTPETKGIGSKAGDKDYLDEFKGHSGSADDVDIISGATYSCTAVKAGVSMALAAFDTIKEAQS